MLSGAVFVLGKGGVGKTTIASGLAALAAKRGRRVLLVRLGEGLAGAERRTPVPAPTDDGYDAVDLDSRFAMDEYIQKVVRVRPLVERITGSEVYRKFFAAAPGLPELVLLGRIRAFAKDRDGHREPRWDSIIVDCPSSGHGLLMLETPFAAFRAVSIGPFARLASEIIEWLRDDARIALVAIPEEMAVVEAVEFADDLRERTALSPSLVFLNRMRECLLSAATRRALIDEVDASNPLDRLLIETGIRVQRRSKLEAFHRKRLQKGLNLDPVVIGEMADPSPRRVATALASGIPS